MNWRIPINNNIHKNNYKLSDCKMRVYLKSVHIGSYYDETDTIGDFEIEGQLQSGKVIQIFDHHKYDLREFKKKEVECLLWAMIKRNTVYKTEKETNELDPTVIFGNFIKNYEIPLKWKRFQKKEEISAIETADGFFLFDYDEIRLPIDAETKKLGLKVIRFDLLDWMPI